MPKIGDRVRLSGVNVGEGTFYDGQVGTVVDVHLTTDSTPNQVKVVLVDLPDRGPFWWLERQVKTITEDAYASAVALMAFGHKPQQESSLS